MWFVSLNQTKTGHCHVHPQLQSPFSSHLLFIGFAYMPERSIWCLKASVQMDISSAKYWNSGQILQLRYYNYILCSQEQNSKLGQVVIWFLHQELKVTLHRKSLLNNKHSPPVCLKGSSETFVALICRGCQLFFVWIHCSFNSNVDLAWYNIDQNVKE